MDEDEREDMLWHIRELEALSRELKRAVTPEEKAEAVAAYYEYVLWFQQENDLPI